MTESQNVEYKSILNDRFERTAVAFFNSRTGGILYIGVEDNGTVVGVKNPDIIQLQIADRLKNNISPSVLGLYDIILENKAGKEVLKIIFSSGPEKPYYIRKSGMTPEGCFIRVGSQTQNLTPQMIESFFARRARNNIRVIEAPRQDLTFTQLKIYYEEHGKPLNEQFASTLEFYTPEKKYNILAYLFADQNGASIKVAKYRGTDKVDLIENEEYGYCSLLKATDRVLDKLHIENRIFTKITEKFRKEVQMYDAVAMREAVINAFVHNDYSDLMTPVFELFSDRLEITSYGGLIDGMTKDELTSGISRPRNREIMRIYKDMELVEQLGSGMNRMMKSYKPDIFKISPNFFHVVLYYNKVDDGTTNGTINGTINGTLKSGVEISESERIVFEEIKKDPRVTMDAIVTNTDLSRRTVARAIKTLTENKVIARIGSKKTGHWEIAINKD